MQGTELAAMFQRAIELVYTAYLVPALLVPFAWLFVWLARRRGRLVSLLDSELRRVELGTAALAALWLLLWAAMKAGAPVDRGGWMLLAAGVLLYLAMNAALAWLLVRFASGYGALSPGPSADRLFLGVVGLFAVQPLVTAMALGVLHRTLGLEWQASMPQFIPGQEGI